MRLFTLLLSLAASCQAWHTFFSSKHKHPSPARHFPCSLSSSFAGNPCIPSNDSQERHYCCSSYLYMRKQKASDKRTSRRQRGEEATSSSTRIIAASTLSKSPMQGATWNHKTIMTTNASSPKGRGRSRKRSNAYQILQQYQNQFLRELTLEYKTEEDMILSRMKRDPLTLEQSGYALFDMELDYRGTLYSEHVYRLSNQHGGVLHHRFKNNDILLLTEQPHGIGDLFFARPLQNDDALQARILNQGPTYIDIVVSEPISQQTTKMKKVYYRVDQFISPVSYERMVNALSLLTAIPSNKNQTGAMIRMDDTLREAILSTYAFTEVNSPLRGDPDVCQLDELSHRLSRPPMGSSERLAAQVMRHFQSSAVFPDFNAPQRTAIQAALTRRMTMIQGPPGTGKTTVAAAIGFGFVHQCRSLSEHTKVLATAFSNVGADNLAEALIRLGLKVVRVGKPSAVSESLWEYTLDAAIQRDPSAKKALEDAGKASARLKASTKGQKSSTDRLLRDLATTTVKASIRAASVAATKALRTADVIVSTSTGAADPQLLAACGLSTTSDDGVTADAVDRTNAPDGLAPISLPFVIIDEACQSVEPATLIPIVASNSCRSLVLLGDPCQLPPTVINRQSNDLSLSLMERLAATLPHPGIIPPLDDSLSKDQRFLDSLSIKQAVSLLRSQSKDNYQRSYRKVYNGSVLLSVQYRMHPSIAALPSALFYNGLLSTPDFLAEKRPFPEVFRNRLPCGSEDLGVRLIDVGGSGNERQGTPKRLQQPAGMPAVAAVSDEEQTTYWNEVEADRVVSLVKEALLDPNVASIGVISPYNGQVRLVKSLLAADSDVKDLLSKHPTSVEVKSVDGYQGRERDVIIFSAVRSNRNGSIGFLHDWRRMNVALTRARSGLIIVGDFDTLASANSHWGALLKWASGVRCLIDESEDAMDDEASV